MPRPSTGTIFRVSTACLLLILASTPRAVEAGPIAEKFKQWSTQRQSKVRVEKPFSNQSSGQENSGPSITQKLKNRLTLKPKTETSTHQMKMSDPFNHGHAN